MDVLEYSFWNMLVISGTKTAQVEPKLDECKALCQGGRLYLKKAVVVDVLTPRECVVEVEGGEVLSDVPQRVLETALPKRGGRVAVLNGPFRGQRGKMLDKSGKGVIENKHSTDIEPPPPAPASV